MSCAKNREYDCMHNCGPCCADDFASSLDCVDAFARSGRGNLRLMRLQNVDSRGTTGYAATGADSDRSPGVYVVHLHVS